MLEIAVSNENKANSPEIAKVETLNNKLDLDRMTALRTVVHLIKQSLITLKT